MLTNHIDLFQLNMQPRCGWMAEEMGKCLALDQQSTNCADEAEMGTS